MAIRLRHKSIFNHLEKIYQISAAREGIAIVALTYPAVQLGRKIHSQIRGTHFYIPFQFVKSGERVSNGVHGFEQPLPEVFQKIFQHYQIMICIMPAAIVIHGLAHLLSNCDNPPSIVVMDSSGKFIINLLGGSDERTGRLISELAKIIGGEAVITGFSQESILPSLGWIAEQKGWKMHPKSQPYALMAALGSHQPVALIKDDELNLPVSIRGFSWPAVFSDWQMAATSGYSNAVVLTCRNIDELLWQNFENVLVYFLPVLVAGVNLVRGISAERVIKTVKDTLLRFNLAPESLVCLATAEDLRDEPGLLEAVSVIECAFRTFSRERINQTKNRTDFLAGGQRYLNRGGVANAVALLASGSDTLLVENQKFKGITVAVAMVKPSTVEAYSDK